MQIRPLFFGATLVLAVVSAQGRGDLVRLSDMVLDGSALLFAGNAPYGRAINGLAFQTEALLTVGDYQYSSWYHFGAGDSQDVYLARRRIDGSTWEAMDTGADMTRTTSDAHNVISMGVTAAGAISLAYDHHGQTLRYRTTGAGAATAATWSPALLVPERSSLNAGGAPVSSVTYPRFFNNPATGGLFMTYRTGASGGGDIMITAYDEAKGMWAGPHEIIDGRDGISYSDPQGSSTTRNAYLNGVDIDLTGRIHVTWTWRETAGGTNHDILYAFSDDGGWTWKNNAGGVVGTAASPIRIDKPGLMIDDGDASNGILGQIDRRNTLMNQQTQVVDAEGRVHLVMWHADDARADTQAGFSTTASAYFHYFRDPTTGDWARRELPTAFQVGSRPDMGTDANGNLYVAYVSPGPGDAGGYYTDGGLVIATASKVTGYRDWEIVAVDGRDFAGEPRLDPTRLSGDGVVSVFLQEHSDTISARTGTPLHVLEYAALGNKLVWAGDHGGRWTLASGRDWDNDGNASGDNEFRNGDRLIFDDSASSFAVAIVEPVAPAAMVFRNTPAHAFEFTGAGIGGTGGLTVAGGGTVRLANSATTVAGEARISSGVLALAAGTSLAAEALVIEPPATLTVGLGAMLAPWSDRLVVSGHAALAGGLQLEVATGAEPTLGERFTLLTAGGVSGHFSSIEGGLLANGVVLAPVYLGDGFAVQAALAGDADLNGQVDIYDLLGFLAGGQFGSGQAATWSLGDANLDGVFNVFDLQAIGAAQAYGQGSYLAGGSRAGTAQAVPEPMFGQPLPGWPLVLLLWLVSRGPRLRQRGVGAATA